MKEITQKTRLEKLLGLTPKNREYETNKIEDLVKLQLSLPIGSKATVQYMDNSLVKVIKGEGANFQYLNRAIEIKNGYRLKIHEKEIYIYGVISHKLSEKIFHPDSLQTVLNKPYFRIEHIHKVPILRLIGDIYTGKPHREVKENKEKENWIYENITENI